MSGTTTKAIFLVSTMMLSLICIILISGGGSAHDMEEVKASYDKDKGQLKVDITHRVADTASHYVNLVEVYREGNKVISQSYTTQSDPDQVTYTYDLDASGGDEIKVRVTCNQLGEVEKTIKVSSKDSGHAFPFLMAGPILAAFILYLGYRRTRVENQP